MTRRRFARPCNTPPEIGDGSGPEQLIGRQDIIRDLARLHRRFLTAVDEDDPLLNELELLAAAATELEMSFSIASKASGIPRERIEAVLESQSGFVRRTAAAYDRQPGDVLCRRVD